MAKAVDQLFLKLTNRHSATFTLTKLLNNQASDSSHERWDAARVPHLEANFATTLNDDLGLLAMFEALYRHGGVSASGDIQLSLLLRLFLT